MSGTITYAVDCASYQGSPDWAKVAAICGGGAEKVTEGNNYVNPRWAGSKPAMQAVARHGFVPMAYLFLDAVEPGAVQASYFAQQAGDLTGFGIIVDGERAPNGATTRQQAADATAELRKLYPHHPIGGYYPHWFTGGEDLTFADWLWASSYVLGSGDPAALYGSVPAAWWAPYGGRTPLMLQFTNQAIVAGIAGQVDCSAFHGSAAQLASHVLPAPPAPKPPPPPPVKASTSGDNSMLLTLRPGDVPVSIPVWADAGIYHEPGAYNNVSLILTGGSGAVVKATFYPKAAGAPEIQTHPMATGSPVALVPQAGFGAVAEVDLQRLDTKTAVGANAAFRTW